MNTDIHRLPAVLILAVLALAPALALAHSGNNSEGFRARARTAKMRIAASWQLDLDEEEGSLLRNVYLNKSAVYSVVPITSSGHLETEKPEPACSWLGLPSENTKPRDQKHPSNLLL